MVIPSSLLRTIIAVVVVGAMQDSSTAVVIESPSAETVMSGPTAFSVSVTGASTDIQSVVFFVDGQQACVATAGARQCQWDAGPPVSSRHVRAVVQLRNGTKLSAALRTGELSGNLTPTFRTTVEIVRVPTRVTDSRDRFVSGMTSEDFRLFEDGRVQQIEQVVEDPRADILLLLDISGSMEPVMGQLKASARHFIGAVRSGDRLTVAGFNTGLYVIAGATADPAVRLAQLARIRAFGRTSFYDSLVRAADLFKTSEGRRVLVVFTDGDDVSSRGSSDTARSVLQAKDVVLYVAGQGRASKDRGLRESIRQLAEETGGASYFGEDMSELDEQFADVLREIGSQYVLSYTSDLASSRGEWRTIRVELVHGRHAVRARTGYFARSPDQ